ncbi:hypothetical protein [Thalassotalea eurytherma]|uniref:hypothetical protein n=1 Tax=Thalassotalea eurytherma TaxID=1144278 RepID=UPI0024E153A1|nr:hypothetical protein [Thalassotalea eurytherma]
MRRFLIAIAWVVMIVVSFASCRSDIDFKIEAQPAGEGFSASFYESWQAIDSKHGVSNQLTRKL